MDLTSTLMTFCRVTSSRRHILRGHSQYSLGYYFSPCRVCKVDAPRTLLALDTTPQRCISDINYLTTCNFGVFLLVFFPLMFLPHDKSCTLLILPHCRSYSFSVVFLERYMQYGELYFIDIIPLQVRWAVALILV